MELSIMYVWLLAGVAFLAAEAMGVTGVGLLFSGLGAIVVGTLLSLGIVAADAHILQFTLFFVATAIWAGILWKPMQKFKVRKNAPGYSNMVGDTAYVGSAGLTKGKAGEATWSGTIMKAELAPDASVDKLDAGQQVTIVNVTGAKLIVKPKE
jgi:membrane protein implicated in regulation of membrane protease activity